MKIRYVVMWSAVNLLHDANFFVSLKEARREFRLRKKHNLNVRLLRVMEYTV